MFKDIKNPTMDELVEWFQIEYSDLTNSMTNSNHAIKTTEPNPYHLEGSVFTHTIMVCLMAKINNSNKVVKLASLLHDIGKPNSREIIPFEVKEGRVVPESQTKTRFVGHEGFSFYLAIDILNKLKELTMINTEEKIEVLNLISLHGVLFDFISNGEMRNPTKIFNKFEQNEKGLMRYNNLIQLCKNDSLGRFFKSSSHKRDSAYKLGTEIYTEQQFIDNMNNKKENNTTNTTNIINIMVGPPCAGKSTFIKDIEDVYNVIISRDSVLMNTAKDRYKEDVSYSEAWKFITENDLHSVVDEIVSREFNTAIKENKNITIDMTNMSNKSRKKYLNNIKGYKKKAIVLCTDYNTILARNDYRLLKENKYISTSVINNMIKSFIVPTYDLFDEIEYIF